MRPLTLMVCATIIAASVIGTCGCTTSNQTSNQTPSASQSAATEQQQNTLLTNYLVALKNQADSNASLQTTAWNLTKFNNTNAHLQVTARDITSNQTLSKDEMITVFPTTQDATNYVDALRSPKATLYSTEYLSGGAYENATGRAPQIYKEYRLMDLSAAYRGIDIQQLDNIVVWDLFNAQTATPTVTPTATPTP